SEEELVSALADLKRKSPDAMFRSALRKLPEHRTATELEMIYDEILHINALKELSNEIKKQLTKVIQFEFHQQVGTTLFHQGDEGRSWYVILSGVVDVLIHGKGVVCSLHEGDDFGNLAIVNDAPRAATIVTAQPNCQFLRVEKFDFVKILNEVEAKTDRLKEHGKDVLILEKNSLKSRSGSMADTLTPSNYKYSIARGTVDKILEHILRYIQPWVLTGMEDSMEDFIITYKLFTDSKHLCEYLLKQYRAGDSLKKGVVYFVVRWSHIHTYIFHEDPDIQSFLKVDTNFIKHISENPMVAVSGKPGLLNRRSSNNGTSGASQVVLTVGTSVQRYPMSKQNGAEPIHDSDKVLLKIYDWNNTYTTVKLPISATVSFQIIAAACEKLSNSPSDFKLVELHENHDTNEIPKRQTSVATAVSLNSRLYLTTTGDHPYLVNKQSASKTIEASHMETVSSLEIAYHLCKHNWNLMNNIHILEFLFKTCGGHKFKWTTSNLNVMARRFNQLAYWPPTEICLCANINKRVQLLRKFIKWDTYLKMYHDMFGFMAVMIGIGNQAVSRLHDTWDKLPSKYRKMVQGFEGILDPSRNHRNYRLFVASTESTRIPYFPLIMKDLTFMQEGNDTFKDDLVNFEKMVITLLDINVTTSVDNLLETTKTAGTTKKYAITCPVITNQVVLNEMSNTVEPKRT
uniref:Rap guanine nucleotide exchange factor 4 n=1 Tax=Ciona savignyi TaxID=51511 RepID=H2Z6D1_CIOSA